MVKSQWPRCYRKAATVSHHLGKLGIVEHFALVSTVLHPHNSPIVMDINPLSYLEVQETTNTLSNIASENVVPAILVDVETISVDAGEKLPQSVIISASSALSNTLRLSAPFFTHTIPRWWLSVMHVVARWLLVR